jgi:hypothetical protein
MVCFLSTLGFLTMNKSRAKISWAAKVACLAPLALLSAVPAQTAQPPARGNVQQPAQSYSPEELKAAVEFMQKHAPHRLAVMESFRNPQIFQRTRQTIVNQKRNFDRIKTNNANSPEIYEARLREFEINDEIFGICKKIQQRPADAKALTPELESKVSELWDLGIKERQARIDRLEKMLAAQKSSLEADEKKRDKVISTKVAEIARNGVEGAKLNFNSGADANPCEDITASPADKLPAKKK